MKRFRWQSGYNITDRVRWMWSKHLLTCTECRYSLSPSRTSLCREGERLWMAYQSLKSSKPPS